jgi:tetratricopeptide (TPR) repeat protein
MTGELKDAEKSYEEAIWRAEASRHDEVSVEAADQLIQIVGYRQGRYAEGERWAQLAAAILQRLGPGHELLAAWRADNLAMVYRRAGRLEEALTLSQTALSMKKRSLGESHYEVALSMTAVGALLHDLGRTNDAIEENQRALEILRRTLGPDHPRMAAALTNAAELMNATGRYAEAQVLAEQAVTISERELSPGHPALAAPLAALGWSWIERGKPNLAIAPLERALWIREAKDPNPSLLGQTRFGLARALRESHHAPDRALSIAAQARNDYQRSPDTKKQSVGVEQWIEARRAQRLSMR